MPAEGFTFATQLPRKRLIDIDCFPTSFSSVQSVGSQVAHVGKREEAPARNAIAATIEPLGDENAHSRRRTKAHAGLHVALRRHAWVPGVADDKRQRVLGKNPRKISARPTASTRLAIETTRYGTLIRGSYWVEDATLWLALTLGLLRWGMVVSLAA